jgi:hypothetical protein
MANGKKAHAARRFAEAAKSYEEALKVMPSSTEAKDALKRAKESKP